MMSYYFLLCHGNIVKNIVTNKEPYVHLIVQDANIYITMRKLLLHLTHVTDITDKVTQIKIFGYISLYVYTLQDFTTDFIT